MNAISRILQSPIYLGKVQYLDEIFPGKHEAIRDKKTHKEIVDSLRRNTRHKGNGKGKAKHYAYLLQGLMVCGHCGGKLTPRTSMGRGNKPYHYYICFKSEKTTGIDCDRNYLDAQDRGRTLREIVEEIATEDPVPKKSRKRPQRGKRAIL